MSFSRYSLDLEASSSQYAYVADNAALSITGDISIEAWIKLEQLPSTSGTYFAIVSKFGTNQYSYEFCIDTDNKLFFYYSSDGAGATATLGTTGAIFTSADVGKWVHVAVNVDVSTHTIELYKMGVSQSVSYTATAATSIFDGTASFAIGARAMNTPDFYMDGLINNLRVWNDIRTGAEILAGMYTTYTGTSNNLVGSWFATANNYEDLAGSNNLTSSGSPTFSTNVPWTGANSTDWTRVDKKIDHTKVSGSANLTNFPMLIKDGNIPDAMYAGLQTDGKDFRITTDSAGEVEVPFEIVAIDTTAKTCEIWAKIPTVSYTADTNLYLWYGNANAVAYDDNAPFGSQAVWSAYSLVDHMQGDAIDETPNALSLTDSSVTYSTDNGKISQGGDFNGATSVVSTPQSTPVNNVFVSGGSFMAWISPDSDGESDLGRIFDKDTGGGLLTQAQFGSTMELQFFKTFSSTPGNWRTTNKDINTGQMQMVVVTYNGENTTNDPIIYINGQPVSVTETQTPVGTITSESTNTLYIGNRADNTRAYDGKIDETRFIKSILTADWIATEYANQNSPSTFIIEASNIKTVSGVPYASIKKISGIAIASVKKVSSIQ